jgi:hypothetical protein
MKKIPVSRLFLLALALMAAPVSAQPHFGPPPAAPSEPGLDQPVSLAGTWRFAMDPDDKGYADKWFNRDLPDRITLPGILQAQGYGDPIRTDTPWVLTLGQAWWQLQPARLRDKFSQPGAVEVPFLAQPPRHYLGVAWYQRDIDVPVSWQGRRVELFLERAHWQTTVWVDAQQYSSDDSLVAPHATDLGVLAPGPHRLSIRVDNRTMLAAQGHLLDAHSVSDQLGAAWNGIVGQITLTATTPVWIDDAQVFPDIVKKSALVKVTIGNLGGAAGQGTLSAGGASAPVTWEASGGSAQLEVPLGADAPLWSEYHPNLLHLTVTLTGGGADDRRDVTFGLREISHQGLALLLNGDLINVRSTHDGGDFPLTGYPAMDVPTWKKIFQVCRDYGLNGMRFHSWCPPDAAFTAADEMGFILQPEAGMWNTFGRDGVMAKRLDAETARLLEAYGNHPSFLFLSPSNEPGGAYTTVTPQWAAAWYQRDPRRLYSAGTGWAAPAQVTSGAQYASLVAFNGVQLRNSRGWFGRDYRAALEGVEIPVFAHEVGQWCAYPDFNVIAEFTGYLRPSNYDIMKYIAQQQDVLDEDQQFAWASGRFQVECYKEEIEANLRTPGLSGIQLLDLHDYLGQGTAFIGVVDAFWHPKSYVTGAEYRRFAGPTVPLARLYSRTFTTADEFQVPVELYHFGPHPLAQATPYWKIVNAAGAVVAQGAWDARDIPIGKNIPLGNATADLSKLPAPGQYKLVVGLKGAPAAVLIQPLGTRQQTDNIVTGPAETLAENDWNFWLYPAQVDASLPVGVIMSDSWPDTEKALAAGGKVLFVPTGDQLDPSQCPRMSTTPVFWNIQMTVRPPRNPTPRFDAMLGLLCQAQHPALAEFPTEANCDWQWTGLINNVRSVNLNSVTPALRPIVATIDDWNRDWRLGVIFECQVGPGRLLVSVIDLINPRSVVAQQLRRSLVDYMAGSQFQPAIALTPDQVRGLWSQDAASDNPAGPRAFDPDLNDGTVPPTPRPGG